MTTSPTNQFFRDLRNLERACLSAVRGEGSEAALSERARRVIEDGMDLIEKQALAPSECAQFRRVMQRIQAIAAGINRFAVDASQQHLEIEGRVRKIVDGNSGGVRISHDQSDGMPTSGEDELVQPYRDWFLSHFAWPYPDSSERQHLLSLVPSHGRSQLSNWFINSRRRSGWSKLCKTYANGTRERFAEWFERVDKGNASQDELDKVEKCKEHFSDKGRNSIRPELEEILSNVGKQGIVAGASESGPSISRRAIRATRVKTEDDREDPGESSRKRHIDEVDEPSTSSSKRTTSGSSTDRSSYDTAPSSDAPPASFRVATPPRPSRELARLPRTRSSSNRATFLPLPPNQCVSTIGSSSIQLGSTGPQLRSSSSPIRPSQRPSRSAPAYRAVSSSFTLDQPNLAGSLNLPPTPPSSILQTANRDLWGEQTTANLGLPSSPSPMPIPPSTSEHFTTLGDEPWTTLYPWLSDILGSLGQVGQ